MLLECARNHFQQLSVSSLLYYDDVILNYLPMTTLSLQGIGALLVGIALIIKMCCFCMFCVGESWTQTLFDSAIIYLHW